MDRSEGYHSYPIDIWVEILLRLPYKKLVQLKRVCKCWHDLVISDEYFIRRHCDLHGTRTVSFVFTKPASEVGINYVSIYFDGDDGDVRVRMRPLPLALDGSGGCSPKLQDSWDGLLLISQSKNLFLYNPVTRSREFLPAHDCIYYSQAYYWNILHDESANRYTVIGIDTRAMDPKVVRGPSKPKCLMLQLHGCDRDYSRSSWKELAPPEGPSEFFIRTPAVRSNGKIYWLIIHAPYIPSKLFSPSLLLSLDLAKQQFFIKPCSPWAAENDYLSWHDGAFYRIHALSCTESELWVLRDLDAERPMWLKHHVIIRHNIHPWIDYWTTPAAVLLGINKLIVFIWQRKRKIAVFDMVSEDWASPNMVGDEHDKYGGWGILPGPLHSAENSFSW